MKYNKKVIMKRAWIMVKSFGLSLSVALKGAWALAKALLAAEKEGKERLELQGRCKRLGEGRPQSHLRFCAHLYQRVEPQARS